MIKTGEKELYYLLLLPAEEMAEHICSLPYSFIELIIETALSDEDFMMDMLSKKVETLKENLHITGAKKALGKLLKVCQVLGCIGSFDFGDWNAFRNSGTVAANIEPIKIIKDIIEAGQLDPNPVNGQYKPYKTMPQFIQWCFNNGYEDDLSPNFILENIFFEGNGGDKLRSIQMYVCKARKGEIKITQ
jgi:hypothetical protein